MVADTAATMLINWGLFSGSGVLSGRNDGRAGKALGW
jgi:hypothetical protein